MTNNLCAVILAGGEGKRMMSDLPKTLSKVLDKPMLDWVITSLKNAGIHNICVVTGYKKEAIEEYLTTLPFEVSTVFQAERLGTGHAVMMAKDFLQQNGGEVVVLNGDAPFMDSQTIKSTLEYHSLHNSSATVISANVSEPYGYGRIVRDFKTNSLRSIVEQKDASEDELKITEVNSGAYCFNTTALLSVLDSIKANNKACEYYLPDALKLLIEKGENVCAFTASSSDTVLGANDPAQLEELNQIAKEKYSN